MRKDILYNKDLILEFIKENKPKNEICRHFKCKPETLNYYLLKMDIEYSGNQSGKGTNKNKSLRKPAMFYIENNKHIGSDKLKKKLIEDGIKEHRCECCKLTDWVGEKIPIELHHIDGNRFNNSLCNLQILCPNCHSKTDNNSGKGIKKKEIIFQEHKVLEIPKRKTNQKKKNKICNCGSFMAYKSTKCSICYKNSELYRKVKRPDYFILIEEIRELGYVKTGEKYGVSDNSIRKWKKYYENKMNF